MPPFSDTVMEHFFKPRNVGRLPSPCGEGVAGSVKRGVYVRMYALVSDGRVQEVRYLTYGCVPAIAAGSVVTEWARGRELEEVLAFTPEQLLDALGGLPRARRFCAELAVNALRDAVTDADRQKGEAK
jgi:nitrogen fixation NifU-like protein